MGLGVLEDKHLAQVPGKWKTFPESQDNHLTATGTCDIYESNNQPTRDLKCDASGPQPTILVPQPSDDPNDPLVRFGDRS